MTPLEDIPTDVIELFEDLSLEVIRSGMRRYSAYAILHRIRWRMHIERGDRAFKCNDHWVPTLSRWFLEKYPQYPKFFELRGEGSLEDEDEQEELPPWK